MRKLSLLLGLVVLLALSSATAEAKKDKNRWFAQYLAEPVMTTAPIAIGVLRRFVVNPHGEVDGMIFQDGTLAKFPPHMTTELTAAVKPGDTVSVRGFREHGGAIKAFIVTSEASKRVVVEHPPTTEKMPKHLRFAMLTRLQAAGKIERVLHGKKGEIKGVILEDGTAIRFAKHAAYQVAAQLQPGQTIAVDGLGTESQYGRGIEAISIGATAQALQPIYGRQPGR